MPDSSLVVDGRLAGSRGSIRNQVVPVLCLLETTKSHLGPGNVFLGVL